MRTLSLAGALATLCWLATSAAAQNYRDTSGDLINPGKAINQSPNNTRIQLGQENFGGQRSYQARSFAPAATPNANVQAGTNHGQPAGAQAGQQNRADQWRYRRFNGQWWYYMPNKSWMVWNGDRWTEPMARAGSAPNQNSGHQ
jgi:hypothetical protein